MKFQKYLSSVEQSFHYTPLAEICIPYKKWKKVVKYHTYPWSLKELEYQCETVDKVFNKAAYCIQNKPTQKSRWNCFGCCTHRKHSYRVSPIDYAEISSQELIRFAEINALAVYKVCKKLEKTEAVKGAMKFLESLRSSHKYSFMGSHRTTQLHLITPEDPIERVCPICFEDLGGETSGTYIKPSQIAMILPCGHYQCFDCFSKMTLYHRIPANFHNRMCMIARSFRCPICRMKPDDAMIHQIAFWPLPPEDVKKGFLPPLLHHQRSYS